MSISNINELNKIFREKLIEQSELDGQFVRNSLSLYGEKLDKFFDENERVSVDENDAILLFELRSRDSESDTSFTENERLSIYKSYTMYIILYGDGCRDVANKIISRFRSQIVREQFNSNKIYLEKIANDISVNEYKNGKMWLRSDIEINFTVLLQIEQISKSEIFEKVETTIYDNKGEKI